MRFEQPTCPACGEPPVGLWEAVPRLIPLRTVKEGEAAGEWEVDEDADDSVYWEGSSPVDEHDLPIPDGDPRIQLHCGSHSWMTRTL